MKVEKKTKVEEAKLTEGTIDDLAKSENTTVISQKDEITEALDEALEASMMAGEGGNWQNVLIVGEAGIGKTAIVKKWAANNGINLVSVKASTMDETDLGGAISPDSKSGDTVKRLASVELDELDTVPNSVLFLDEFNRARKSVRGTLLTLIQDHVIADPRVKGKERQLKNFLFTIACINPNQSNYNTDELDDAERGRFREIRAEGNPSVWLTWVTGDLDKKIEQFKNKPEWVTKLNHRKDIIKKLVSSKEFKFDNTMDIQKSHDEGNGLALSPRTLTNLLYTSNGTKDDFLSKWDQFCNSLRKPMAERVLKNYVDKDDKANSVFKGNKEQEKPETAVEENPFGDVTGDWDKIMNAFPGEL